MLKEFKGDYRILRVVLESKDPLHTLHQIRSEQYSVITLLDMLEMLDVRDTIREEEMFQEKIKSKQNKG